MIGKLEKVRSSKNFNNLGPVPIIFLFTFLLVLSIAGKVMAVPSITRIQDQDGVTMTSGYSGKYCTVIGSGFGADQGASTVTVFGTTPVRIVVWADTTIMIHIPNVTPGTGNITVTVSGTPASISFTVNTPVTKTMYVSSSGSNTAPYDTWQKAATSIQTVVGVAYPNDTIIVGAGTYTGNTAGATVYITNSGLSESTAITLRAAPGANVIIDGGTTLVGIHGANSDYWIIDGLSFTRCSDGIWSNNWTVRNCKFYNNSTGGISSVYAHYFSISNCMFYNNQYGLQLLGTNTGTVAGSAQYIYNNVFANNQIGYYGFTWNYYPVLKNNIFYNNTTANIRVDHSSKYLMAANGLSYNFNNYNVFKTTGTYFAQWDMKDGTDGNAGADANLADLSAWRTATSATGGGGSDANSSEADPLFVNASANDFHLQWDENGYDVDSPAIGNGTTSPMTGITTSGNMGVYDTYRKVPPALSATKRHYAIKSTKNKDQILIYFNKPLNETDVYNTSYYRVESPIGKVLNIAGNVTITYDKTTRKVTLLLDNKAGGSCRLDSSGGWKVSILAGMRSLSGNAVVNPLIYSAMNYDELVLDAGEAGEIISADDTRTRLIIPKGAVDKAIKFTITKVDLNTTSEEQRKALIIYNFKGEDAETGKTISALSGNVYIKIGWNIVGGYVDGTNMRVSLVDAKDRLKIGFWNGIRWVPLTSQVDIDGNNIIVSCKIAHLSQYGILVKAAGESIKFSAAPNPFTPMSSDSRFNAVNFTFDNPDNDTVEAKIYDVTGVLVRRIDASGGTSIGWDGRNEYGEVCEGGVYIYQVKVGNSVVGKGTVILAK